MKELKQTPYSQEEADRAAGLMKEVLPPAHGGVAPPAADDDGMDM